MLVVHKASVKLFLLCSAAVFCFFSCAPEGGSTGEADASAPDTAAVIQTDDTPSLAEEDLPVTDSDITNSDSFHGSIILGAPSPTSITAKIYSLDQSGTIFIAYSTTPDSYDRQSTPVALEAGKPAAVKLEGLTPDTLYYYRLDYRSPGADISSATEEYSFHTARPAGSSFTFTLQADPHLDENSNPDFYYKTLENVQADHPDFHIDLGDTFMCEKHIEPLSEVQQAAQNLNEVHARYAYETGNFGRITHSVPLFLVNGNHEGEAGWFLNGTAENLAVWASRARQEFFANPVPDGFYTGDTADEPFIGKRGSWYAWEWGNALFVVLDPYWYTKNKGGKDAWVHTLGKVQYDWLKKTLAESTAAFKFIFIHNLIGGLQGQMRGGIEAAPYYEWGGKNEDGTEVFGDKRPGWELPIHQLLVKNGVSAVFHGHDHLYARQELDGIVYLEVPQPSAKNYKTGPNLATEFQYTSGIIASSSGHIRVTVSPEKAVVQYVRAWLPEQEKAGVQNGQIDDEWVIEAP